MHHSLPSKFLILLFFAGLLLLIGYWGLKAPRGQDNICQLFKDHPSWRHASVASQQKWSVPISVQFAIIHQESHFRANAAPSYRKLFGLIPWSPTSSAHGYMQALNSTWHEYLHSVHKRGARRSSFYNATDFIGWYVNKVHKQLAIPRSDAYKLYLAYHEGAQGYLHKSYLSKPWLIKVAHKVQQQAYMYHHQLLSCQINK